jgi:MFS family permease
MELNKTKAHYKTLKLAEYATKALFFACGFGFSSWASRIPEIKEKLNLNDAEFGTVLFAMPIGSLSALPIAGYLINKYGSKNITFLACLIYLINMPFLGLANNSLFLSISLFLFGFGGDILNIAMNVQAVGVEKGQKRSIMNIFHAIFSIGFMIGVAAGGIIIKSKINPFLHFTSVGISIIIISIISLQFLIKQDEKPKETQPIFVWPDKSLITLGLICFCGMLSEGAMVDWSVIYYKKILVNSNELTTTGFQVFSISMVLGRLMGDKILKKIGLSKLLSINSLLLIIGITFALITIKPILVVIGFGITGFGLSTMVPLIYSEAGHTKTMSSGVALAAISTIGMMGFLLGPVLIGYLSEFSNLRVALSLLIMLGIISVFLARRLKV